MDRIKITVCQKNPLSHNDFFYFLWSFMKEESSIYKPDFLIFPEYYLTDVIDGERPFTNPYLHAAAIVAKKYECYIILGSIKEKFNNKWYNTTFIIGPGGELITRYRKQRPWRSEKVNPGNVTGIFETKFGKIGILICYDGDQENHDLMLKLLAEKPRFVFIPIDMAIPSYYDTKDLKLGIWKTAIKNVSKRFFPLACKYDVTFIRADYAYQNREHDDETEQIHIHYGASIIIKPYQMLPAPTWYDCCYSTFVEEKMYKSEVANYAVDLNDDTSLDEYYSFIDDLDPTKKIFKG